MPKIPLHISKLIKDNQGINLDIGCGESKRKGSIGMDKLKLKGVDIVHDLEKYPYPLPDNCVKIVIASHILEHINPADSGFIKFMDEIWRIMKPQGEFMISVPYAGSPGYWQDPTHVNGINETTFTYFDPLASTNFYRFYRPKPWKIEKIYWDVSGTLEALLSKRLIDKSYEN